MLFQLPASAALISGDAGKLTHTTLQRALFDMGSRVKRTVTWTTRMPRQVVVHSQPIKHITSQVVLQVKYPSRKGSVRGPALSFSTPKTFASSSPGSR